MIVSTIKRQLLIECIWIILMFSNLHALLDIDTCTDRAQVLRELKSTGVEAAHELELETFAAIATLFILLEDAAAVVPMIC